MKLPGKTRLPTADLRRVALAALVSALDGDQPEPKDKSGRSTIRTLAAGAVIYAAGVAAFKNRNLIREQLLASQHADDEAPEDEDEFVDDDEFVVEDEARGEPDPDEDFEESERDDDEPEDAPAAPRRKRPTRSRS